MESLWFSLRHGDAAIICHFPVKAKIERDVERPFFLSSSRSHVIWLNGLHIKVTSLSPPCELLAKEQAIFLDTKEILIIMKSFANIYAK